MGVHKLKKFQNQDGSEVGTVETTQPLDYLTAYAGKYVFIDTNVVLYKTKAMFSDDNDEGNYIGHFSIIYSYYKRLHTGLGIKLVWVFEPKITPSNKVKTSNKRKENLDRVNISSIDMDSTQRFIRSLGMVCIVSDAFEAEHLASILAIKHESCVLTTDTDVIAYGSVLVNVSLTRSEVTVLRHEDVIKHLGVDREKFLKICCLLGTDTCEKTPRFGPKGFKKVDNVELSENQLEYLKYVEDASGYDMEIPTETCDERLALDILIDAGVGETNKARRELSTVVEVLN